MPYSRWNFCDTVRDIFTDCVIECATSRLVIRIDPCAPCGACEPGKQTGVRWLDRVIALADTKRPRVYLLNRALRHGTRLPAWTTSTAKAPKYFSSNR